VDQSNGKVIHASSGETSNLCAINAPWMGINPAGATLQPGDHQDVVITFYTVGFRPGDYTGQLNFTTDTPYNVANFPVTLHNVGQIFFLPSIMKPQ
jgi:hypothetical protein